MTTSRAASKSSDEEPKKKRIKFTCQFTDEIRQLIRRKRNQLGLSYAQMADFLGINWTTIRKWEKGPTGYCELVYRPKIEGFINGDFDDDFIDKGTLASKGYEPPMPEAVYQCFERIAGVCTLCNGNETIIQELVEHVDEATRKALSELIAKELIDPEPQASEKS